MITNTPIKISTHDFLKSFYCDDDKKVYIRLFDDKKKQPYGKNECVRLADFDSIIPNLVNLNAENWGVFFVVNGGGQTDKEVLSAGCAQAQFMEIDDLPFDEQLEKINAFPLQPSVVVRTKKSMHCYWLLRDGDITRFRNIQLKLIKHFGSDAVVKNESRVMRLPNFYHNKGDPVLVQVIHFQPDKRYTQDELESYLPALETKQKNVKRIEATSTNQPKGDLPFQPVEHYRVKFLVSQIGKYKNDGFPDDLIWKMVQEVNTKMCKPPVDKERMQREVYPAIQRFKTESVKPIFCDRNILDALMQIHPEYRYKWDDRGNGELYADVFKNRIRWNVTAREWYQYNGKVWLEDTGGMVAARLAKELFDALLVYLSTIDDVETQNDYMKHITKLGQLKFRKTMLEDAKDKFYISADMLDVDDYLLNVQNGVLNLHTFELMEHRPDMLLSKICNVTYDPAAVGLEWVDFINTIMERNQEKITYLQKILGYSLTGDTREETCFILYGKLTRNGKSTLVETISYMLGDAAGYALTMKPESLAIRNNNDSRQASGDIARLKNCRFLNASEPPKRMVFDVGLLKSLLGRDTITARFLHQSEFQFVPKFKLFINTNFLPLITDDTLFSSGRLNVIEFNRHFSESEQDKTLKDKLREPKNLSGVLNWCLAGLELYQKQGAKPPDDVINATADYRIISDKIGNFIAERLEESPDHNLSAKIVYEMYSDWCKDNGYGQENKGNFFAELRTKGLLVPSGTVNGRTIRNVVVGYTVSNDYASRY